MARPRKWRRVCTLPRVSTFGPVDLSLGVNGKILKIEGGDYLYI